MNAIVCDRCEKVITSTKEMDDTTKIQFSTRLVGAYQDMHLCDDCLGKFQKWIEKKEKEDGASV